jgi:cysteine desulfurase/selenocysteine lyase
MRSQSPWRDQVIGVDMQVPLLAGGSRPYVNLDNASSTPVLKPVLETVVRFLPWYASIHRGTGFKSKLSTWAYEEARARVLEFVGADPKEYVASFVRNTTEAVNKLAWRLGQGQRKALAVTTLMEHHSNDLPWRRHFRLLRLPLDSSGFPEFDRLEDLLSEHSGQVRLVAVTGASNVTGLVTPIHELARIAHRHGAHIFVDAAQLAPHKPIRVQGDGREDSHIDFLAFSAHKMYAPFGSGALVARRDLLREIEPFEIGGGTVLRVSTDSVIYADPPWSEEAGSPNVVGAIALAAAIHWFQTTGMSAVEAYEHELARATWEILRSIPEVDLYGPAEFDAGPDRLGVFSFNLRGWHHAKLAAVLAYEFGIGVRNGCFCAQPYVKALLGVNRSLEEKLMERSREGTTIPTPGAVRVSLGFYNSLDEVQYLGQALSRLATGEFEPRPYRLTAEGEYIPEDGDHDFAGSFRRLVADWGFPTGGMGGV